MNPMIEERERKGLTRMAMARKLGISYDFLSKIEVGYWPKLPPGFLRQLASAGYSQEDLQRMQAEYTAWRSQDIGSSAATA